LILFFSLSFPPFFSLLGNNQISWLEHFRLLSTHFVDQLEFFWFQHFLLLDMKLVCKRIGNFSVDQWLSVCSRNWRRPRYLGRHQDIDISQSIRNALPETHNGEICKWICNTANLRNKIQIISLLAVKSQKYARLCVNVISK